MSILALIEAAGTAKDASELVSALVKLPDYRTKRFIEAWAEVREQWLLEVAAQVRLQADYLRDLHADVAALRALLVDPQFERVFHNYGAEAEREATDERRKMLACAFAGSADPTLTIAGLARAERAIRELDPDDVRCLYGVSRCFGVRDLDWTRVHNEDRLRYVVWRRYGLAESLISSGCGIVSNEAGAGPELRVTRTGSLVLRVLHAYVALRGAPFEIPDRRPREGERSETDALSYVRARPKLKTFLLCAKAPGATSTFIDDPHGGPSVVCVNTAPGDQDKRPSNLAAAQQRARDAAGDAGPELAVNVGDFKPWSGGQLFNVHIHGPRDLLLAVADECGARWSEGTIPPL